MREYYLSNIIVCTLEGVGTDSVSKTAHTPLKSVLQPKELKGAVLKIDPATGLVVAATLELCRELSDMERVKTGIITGTRAGNHQAAKKYGDKIRNNSASPSLYSVSGPNICAGLPALACKCKGPTLVLPGMEQKIADLLLLGTNYINRQDAEHMLIGQVDITNNGCWGMAVFMLISAVRRHDYDCKVTVNREVSGEISVFAQKKKDRNILSIYSDYLLEVYTLYMHLERKEMEPYHLKSKLNSCVTISLR